jgi:hypothetical protein
MSSLATFKTGKKVKKSEMIGRSSLRRQLSSLDCSAIQEEEEEEEEEISSPTDV